MKASELIIELQRMIDVYGDLPAQIQDWPDGGWSEVADVVLNVYGTGEKFLLLECI